MLLATEWLPNEALADSSSLCPHRRSFLPIALQEK